MGAIFAVKLSDLPSRADFPFTHSYVQSCRRLWPATFLPQFSFYCSREDNNPPSTTWAVLCFSREEHAKACAQWLSTLSIDIEAGNGTMTSFRSDPDAIEIFRRRDRIPEEQLAAAIREYDEQDARLEKWRLEYAGASALRNEPMAIEAAAGMQRHRYENRKRQDFDDNGESFTRHIAELQQQNVVRNRETHLESLYARQRQRQRSRSRSRSPVRDRHRAERMTGGSEAIHSAAYNALEQRERPTMHQIEEEQHVEDLLQGNEGEDDEFYVPSIPLNPNPTEATFKGKDVWMAVFGSQRVPSAVGATEKGTQAAPHGTVAGRRAPRAAPPKRRKAEGSAVEGMKPTLHRSSSAPIKSAAPADRRILHKDNSLSAVPKTHTQAKIANGDAAGNSSAKNEPSPQPQAQQQKLQAAAPAEPKPPTDHTREVARNKITTSLTEGMTQQEKEASVELTTGKITAIAQQIDEEVLILHPEAKNYAKKMLALTANLKRNTALRESVLSGALDCTRLVNMTAREMDTQENMEWKRKLEEKSLKASLMPDDATGMNITAALERKRTNDRPASSLGGFKHSQPMSQEPLSLDTREHGNAAPAATPTSPTKVNAQHAQQGQNAVTDFSALHMLQPLLGGSVANTNDAGTTAPNPLDASAAKRTLEDFRVPFWAGSFQINGKERSFDCEAVGLRSGLRTDARSGNVTSHDLKLRLPPTLLIHRHTATSVHDMLASLEQKGCEMWQLHRFWLVFDEQPTRFAQESTQTDACQADGSSTRSPKEVFSFTVDSEGNLIDPSRAWEHQLSHQQHSMQRPLPIAWMIFVLRPTSHAREAAQVTTLEASAAADLGGKALLALAVPFYFGFLKPKGLSEHATIHVHAAGPLCVHSLPPVLDGAFAAKLNEFSQLQNEWDRLFGSNIRLFARSRKDDTEDVDALNAEIRYLCRTQKIIVVHEVPRHDREILLAAPGTLEAHPPASIQSKPYLLIGCWELLFGAGGDVPRKVLPMRIGWKPPTCQGEGRLP